MMAATMNGFYGWKRLTGNQPIDVRSLATVPGGVPDLLPAIRWPVPDPTISP